MQNACMNAAKFFMEHGKFRHLAYMYFECFRSSSKSLLKMFRYYINRKSSRTSIDSITSEASIFVISLTLWPLSHCLLTSDSTWVDINLFSVISIVMRGQNVSLSFVKTNGCIQKHAKLHSIFVSQILKANYKTPLSERRADHLDLSEVTLPSVGLLEPLSLSSFTDWRLDWHFNLCCEWRDYRIYPSINLAWWQLPF